MACLLISGFRVSGCEGSGLNGGFNSSGPRVQHLLTKLNSWTLEVCRIIAFDGYWAILLLTFEGLG